MSFYINDIRDTSSIINIFPNCRQQKNEFPIGPTANLINARLLSNDNIDINIGRIIQRPFASFAFAFVIKN